MKELILETASSVALELDTDGDRELDLGGAAVGTRYHDKLKNRDLADQHPISAITGLEEELKGKQPAGDYVVTEKLQDRNVYPIATTADKGVIKVGYNLAVTPEGMLYLPLSTEAKEEAVETENLNIGDKAYRIADTKARTAADNAQDTADDALVLIAKLREDFEYKPITVSSVSCNVAGTQELGKEIRDVKISWKLSKEAVSQSVNGTQVPVQEGVKSYSYTDPASYKPTAVTTKKWTVTATDERGAAAQGSVSVTFLNGIYTGAVQGNGQPTRDTMLALTKKLQNSRTLNFTATAASGWYLIYALPTRLGTPAFKDKDTGFEAGFTKIYPSVSFENGSGYTENYDIWLSNKSGLGTITVAVT